VVFEEHCPFFPKVLRTVFISSPRAARGRTSRRPLTLSGGSPPSFSFGSFQLLFFSANGNYGIFFLPLDVRVEGLSTTHCPPPPFPPQCSSLNIFIFKMFPRKRPLLRDGRERLLFFPLSFLPFPKKGERRRKKLGFLKRFSPRMFLSEGRPLRSGGPSLASLSTQNGPPVQATAALSPPMRTCLWPPFFFPGGSWTYQISL